MTRPWRLSLAELESRGETLALVGLEPSSTYREVARRAARIVERLADAGLRPGDRVALLFAHRSHGEAIALAAVLLAGAVAVPLDPSGPPRRMAAMVRSGACRALIRDAGARALAGALPQPLLQIELADDGGPSVRVGEPGEPSEPTPDVACVLHTSGTTGAPKPVDIRWEGLDAFTRWMVELTGLGLGVRVLRVAELIFDLAWFDHVATWRVGATLCTLSRRELATPRSVAERVRSLRPHVIYAVPAFFMKLLAGLSEDEQVPGELGVVCYAGEVFPPGPLQAFSRRLGSARLLNLFGPTETNVCTFHEIDRALLDGRSEVPIGIAPPYARCSLVRVGSRNELIDGAGTGELVVEGPTALGGRFFTGDRVERGDDGLFYFRGRLDRMVKIRGYRVQPTEVEAALLEHPAVREAAVTVAEHPRLGAVLRGHVTLRSDQQPVEPRQLRAFVAERLAPYMVPQQIELLSALPRASTGKVDYAALRQR